MEETDKFIVRICCEPQIKIVDDDGIASFIQKITTMRAKRIDEGIIGQLRELMRVEGIDELYAIDESKVLEMVKKSQAFDIIRKYFWLEDFQDFIAFNGRLPKELKEECDALREVILCR